MSTGVDLSMARMLNAVRNHGRIKINKAYQTKIMQTPSQMQRTRSQDLVPDSNHEILDEDPLLISQSLTYVTDDGSVLHSFQSAPFSYGMFSLHSMTQQLWSASKSLFFAIQVSKFV